MKTCITHTEAETQGDRCSVNESSAHDGNRNQNCDAGIVSRLRNISENIGN